MSDDMSLSSETRSDDDPHGFYEYATENGLDGDRLAALAAVLAYTDHPRGENLQGPAFQMGHTLGFFNGLPPREQERYARLAKRAAYEMLGDLYALHRRIADSVGQRINQTFAALTDYATKSIDQAVSENLVIYQPNEPFSLRRVEE